MLLSFVLAEGAGLFLAGLILILVAVGQVASLTKNREKNSNMQLALVSYVIGTIIGFVFVYRGFPSFNGLGFTGPLLSTDPLATFLDRYAGIRIIGLLATWFFFVVASFFLKKGYDSIATSMNIELFRTTGIVFLIGSVLLIVFGAGLVILFLAATIQIAAWLSLSEESRNE